MAVFVVAQAAVGLDFGQSFVLAREPAAAAAAAADSGPKQARAQE